MRQAHGGHPIHVSDCCSSNRTHRTPRGEGMRSQHTLAFWGSQDRDPASSWPSTSTWLGVLKREGGQPWPCPKTDSPLERERHGIPACPVHVLQTAAGEAQVGQDPGEGEHGCAGGETAAGSSVSWQDGLSSISPHKSGPDLYPAGGTRTEREIRSQLSWDLHPSGEADDK